MLIQIVTDLRRYIDMFFFRDDFKKRFYEFIKTNTKLVSRFLDLVRGPPLEAVFHVLIS